MGKSHMDIVLDIIKYCDANNILWFNEIVDYATDNNKKSWINVLRSNKGTYLVSTHLARKAHAAGLLTDKQLAEWEEDDFDEW